MNKKDTVKTLATVAPHITIERIQVVLKSTWKRWKSTKRTDRHKECLLNNGTSIMNQLSEREKKKQQAIINDCFGCFLWKSIWHYGTHSSFNSLREESINRDYIEIIEIIYAITIF